jgi:hypothetical protein
VTDSNQKRTVFCLEVSSVCRPHCNLISQITLQPEQNPKWNIMIYFFLSQESNLSRNLTYFHFNPEVKQLGKTQSVLIREISHYATWVNISFQGLSSTEGPEKIFKLEKLIFFISKVLKLRMYSVIKLLTYLNVLQGSLRSLDNLRVYPQTCLRYIKRNSYLYIISFCE